MSVTVSESAGTAYTWATATFAWNSSTATKTWQNALTTAYEVAVAQTLAMSSTPSRDAGKAVAETLAVADDSVRAIGLVLAQALQMRDGLARDVARVIDETLTVGELGSRHSTKPFAESFALAERLIKDVGLACAETLAFIESYRDNIQFLVAISEGFALAENRASNIDAAHFDGFAIGDARQSTVGKRVSDALSVLEEFARVIDYKRAFLELVTLQDSAARDVTVRKIDSFAVDDALAKEIGLNPTETLAIVDVFARSVIYQRELAEGVSVTDAAQKAMSKPVQETLAFFDELVRNPDAVMSDLEIRTDAPALDGFTSMMSKLAPPGFNVFERLVSGDYEFKKALIRYVLKTKTADRPQLTHARAVVDMPDVIDSGPATLIAGDNVIAFNRTFHIVPEVTATLRAGTVFAIPRITAITETDFTVHLEASDGTKVAGDITWNAKGY